MRRALSAVVLAVLRAALRIIDWSLRTLGYRRSLRVLARSSPGWRLEGLLRSPPLVRAERTSAWVHRAARDLSPSDVNVTCLRRSLASWWLARWLGVQTEIRIGLDPADRELAGHAWLDLDGIVVGDGAEVGQRFTLQIEAPTLVGRGHGAL